MSIGGLRSAIFGAALLYLTLSLAAGATIADNVNAVSAWPRDSIELGCLGDNTPQWWFNGSVLTDDDIGISISSFTVFNTLTIDSFAESLAGVYTCSDSDGDATVVVSIQDYSLDIVGQLPLIEGGVVNVTCEFQSEGFMVSKYDWTATDRYGNTARDLNVSGSQLIIVGVASSDEGRYQCEVTLNTSNSVVLTTSVDVDILLVPVAGSPSSLTLSPSDPLNITCNITGDQLTYSWTMGGNPLVGVARYSVDTQSGVLTIQEGVVFADTGLYECTATNDAGSVSLSSNISVIGAPIISSPNDQSYQGIEGSSLFLPCLYQSNPVAMVTLNYPTPAPDSAPIPTSIPYSSGGFSLQSLSLDDIGIYYCVTSNEIGSSNISYTVNVIGLPHPPSGVSVQDVDHVTAVVEWEEFIGPLPRQPECYTVVVTNEGKQVGGEYTTNDTSVTLMSGLIPDTQYSVWVTAHNTAGSSGQSQEVIFTTDKSAPRFQHFNITALDGGRSLQFDWLLLYDGGDPVSIFTVIVTSPYSMPLTFTLDVGVASEGSLLVPHLEPNIAYGVQVSLGNVVDTSFTQYTTVTSEGPPIKPTTPTINQVLMRSAQLSFNILSIGSAPVDQYTIRISPDNGATVRVVTLPTNHTHVLTSLASGSGNRAWSAVLLVTSLDTDSTYSFSVSAGGVAGDSPFSDYSEPVTTESASLLYYIIGSVVVGSVLIILILVLIAVVLVCSRRRKNRQIAQKHTITERLHEPNDFGFPNSSISETVHVVEDYSPPPSSMDTRKEDILSPPPYPGFVRVNHHRTHSVSSTASSQMYRKPEYLRSPTEPFHHMDTSDSAYGGSAEKGVNHLYHEIPPPRCSSAIGGGGGEHRLVSHSFPSINRVTSYDVDNMPPRPNCATNV